jgi:hypothetical protein
MANYIAMKKQAIVGGLLAAGVSAALLGAGPAHADSTGEVAYVNDLASVGVTNSHGAQAMVNNGNAICRELRAGMSPSYEASTIYNGTNGWPANNLTQVQSNRMVTFAMQDLC